MSPYGGDLFDESAVKRNPYGLMRTTLLTMLKVLLLLSW